ncbi:GerMN domain-containing protein [Candidatus Bipolaricaulota bacterium]|nr:GerMN domain-containing protein [Candidatus Bipolaricaulota bacterium]
MKSLSYGFETVSIRRLILSLFLAILLAFLLLFPERKANKESSNKVWNKVEVFFQNSELNTEKNSCLEVHSVQRWVDSTTYPPMAALRELLKGPTEEEKKEGYFTSINSGVMIKGFWIEEETAKVMFSGRIEDEVAGTCLVRSIISQIHTTLIQFDNIEKTKVYVNKRSAKALQP